MSRSRVQSGRGMRRGTATLGRPGEPNPAPVRPVWRMSLRDAAR